jgi:hypothetical protein
MYERKARASIEERETTKRKEREKMERLTQHRSKMENMLSRPVAIDRAHVRCAAVLHAFGRHTPYFAQRHCEMNKGEVYRRIC